MFNKLKSFFSDMFWKNVEVSKKPLTKLSILFVIIFDIFLFNNIWNWYEYQGNIVTRPYDYHKCYNLYNSFSGDKENFITNLNSYYSNPNWKYSDFCNNVNNYFSNSFNTSLKDVNDSLRDINQKIANKNYDISRYEREYDKYKSESISGIDSYDDRLSWVTPWQSRAEYLRLKSELENLEQIKTDIINSFTKNTDYIALVWYLNSSKKDFSEKFESDLFWYPAKIAFFQAVLLFPVFLISLFCYKLYLRRQNRILTILFSNLTFISGIFVFILFFKFIYFILPKKFFASLILMLQNLNLWFLWNYILIFIWILIFGLIIYLSQKGWEKLQLIREENEKKRVLENKQRIVKERFFAWKCVECNSKLLDDSRFCSHCWFDQYFECRHCWDKNPVSFDFCKKCWTNKYKVD